MDLYAENILEHHRHPRHKSPIANPTIEHAENNPACGDAITLELKITKGKITAASWNGSGCALSQAGISILLEKIAGMKAADAAKLSPKDMRSLLGVPLTTRRLQCAFLPLMALHNALRKWKDEPTETWPELLDQDQG
ncbi:MAG: iron-sulfur cluster assembly scaffold protein [Candidatus Peribacteraceae bacterium]|nr:iron-sulfur cluster assembly scaffold protein [Candidatus Peribacteraceae bacterium]MDD5739332.1 iron-sulfur cluster assembly scaffold protein [Candidatus Peribacteraceae bacterium]